MVNASVTLVRYGIVFAGLLLVASSISWVAAPHAPPAPSPNAPANACKTLQERLCGDLASTENACVLAKHKMAEFTTARCRAMLERYPRVVDELADLASGTRALTATEQRLPHLDAPSIGPPHAELTLVEFADFQAADCGRAAPMAHMLQALFPDRVRLVFRQYPSRKDPDAHLAAEASLAAQAQGKFWEYHDVLFANPHDLRRPALERYAGDVGLDMVAFRRALDARLYAADVDADVALGRAVQALSVPSLYANGEPVPVPYGVAELRTLVEGALSARTP
jgi:protein-disulfide isomerase